MKKAVICFTRVPRAGQTKTRLMPLLTGEQCALLHTAFLNDISSVYKSAAIDLFVFFAPDPDFSPLKNIFPFAKGFFVQKGADLGERMQDSTAHVLGLGYDGVILTGSDLPALTARHLESGFDALEKADIAIGENPDGGYYLIGMKQPHTAPFTNQNYGGSTVYQNTLAAIKAANLTVCSALPCTDVDTPSDLTALIKSGNMGCNTKECIDTLRKAGVSL